MLKFSSQSNWWLVNNLFRVSSTEIARSVERLLPELLTKSGDTTPRIHNMAVHTILSMADCKCVRELHIIPVHLTRPVNSSTHQRLALSRLEMVEQLMLSHGISTEKQRWFWTIFLRYTSLHKEYLSDALRNIGPLPSKRSPSDSRLIDSQRSFLKLSSVLLIRNYSDKVL